MGMMNGFNLNPYMDLINLQSKDASQYTLAGSKISSWNDGVSAWSQGTDANRPTLTSGTPIFDGTDQLVRASEISATTFSLYVVFKDIGSLAKVLLGGSTGYDYLMHNAVVNFDSVVMAAGGISKAEFKAGMTGNRYVILSIRRNGNTITAKLNDRILLNRFNVFAGQPTLIARLAGVSNTTFNMNAGIKAVCMSSQNLSDADDKKVRDKLYSDYNLASDTAADYVLGIGDSNTQGINTPSYLFALAAQLNVADANAGISSSRLTAFDASSGVTRYPNLISRPYTDYVVIQYGSNDAYASVSQANYEAALNTMVGGFISAGYSPNKICICSVPYIKDNYIASILDSYRASVINVKNTYGTKYFDLLQATRDGGGNTLLSDDVHLNSSGQTIWTNGAYTALTT